MVKNVFNSLLLFFFSFLLISACNNKSSVPVSSSTFQLSAAIEKPKKLDKKIKVALVPFSGVDASYATLLKSEIEIFYTCDITILPGQNLPDFAYYKPRNRYKADSLLKFLNMKRPKEYNLILGITNKDISTKDETHEDWGIFGLGFLGGPSCVVSDFRLKKSAKDINQLHERLIKVVLHELGHTFGLPHCSAEKSCLMEDADGTIKSVDREEKHLCESCKKKLPKGIK
ncbi:MAG: Zn-dependent protease [Bacteroidetes bacterium]|nr:Zn-dependent protease [Bacteroidota bacterium]